MLPVQASLARTMSAFWDPLGLGQAAIDYWRDTVERSVLYLDVMRQRGNQYLEHMEQTRPSVLGFEVELLVDGRDLPRPVNYELMRIVPPEGIEIDEDRRPFVVVDPRAGHGPGIGGFKPDSEIGVALRAGHPCYFIGFLPFPVPGQTVLDVVEAEAHFLHEVIARHPQTVEKPMVVGNCQAGWQLMMAAALEPDCFGPILIAGAPLSYWAGERGKAPMRYSGGMTGGSWVTAFASDLGAGNFDGAWLVQNFEKLNPANTLWTKQYRLFANIDTEADRYLEFERWWGGHVVLAGEEIQYIVDNLFVGNRLSTAQLLTRDGRRIDLRNIRSPIVVFCSKGDDITPPPQALGWITDLYDSVEDIQANEQTIVYCVHDTTGHLGIFVSGSVSRKEHAEFTANMDYIDILPPGLYETQVTERPPSEAAPVDGDYLLEFTPRGLKDVDEIVQPLHEDERRFATVARLSEINLGLYQRYLQPWMHALMTPEAARWIRRMHPIRLGYKLLSDRNPATVPLPVMADYVRANRARAGENNPFRIAERMLSDDIVRMLDSYRDVRDRATEWTFMEIYGQPWLQILAGLGVDRGAVPSRRPGQEPEHRRFVSQRREEMRARIDQGDVHDAVMRAIIFVLGGAPSTDERNFQRLKATRAEVEPNLDLERFKALVREQFFILKLDPQAALGALPTLLEGESAETIDAQLQHIEHVVEASAPLSDRTQDRLGKVRTLFLRARQAVRDASPVTALGGETGKAEVEKAEAEAVASGKRQSGTRTAQDGEASGDDTAETLAEAPPAAQPAGQAASETQRSGPSEGTTNPEAAGKEPGQRTTGNRRKRTPPKRSS
ncbi:MULTISPECIES: DUF3141 domain-containing protein [unclassified Modicisalibacter]|uniref:DUF3141 domain-containing protein n=1 Tax=unclassified Modicisalibacter TaxID=2679913 RepID=UPI001CCFE9B1|nr:MULTISPECIES: DUF3141 domain-containing protein [unclassified Modicisalibacter]MBZ9560351.1 DUF3141 domain-containing protein [Modicisalibacter sp. R2A 31.J]MBZ9576260.1 DUF3141 domain-containing protein [Modicisalibacter sp. MOD 31.J]